MENSNKNRQDKLMNRLASLMLMLFLSGIPFENNPHNCELVSRIEKKKKD
jgi:hypothetical protein